MKKKKIRQQFVVLISILILMLIFLGSAQAEEQPDNSEYNTNEPKMLTVDLDKAEVKDGDKVKVTINFENPIGAELSNVSLETIFPDGITGKNTSKAFEHVASGEKVTYTVDAEVGVPVTAAPSSKNPTTGAGAFGAAALLAVLLLLVVASIGAYSRHKNKKLLSLVLALVLTAQMGASIFIRPVQAEESQNEETCVKDITQTATTEITVNGSLQQITAELAIGEARAVDTQETTTDILETNDTVATGARFFTVVVNAPDKSFKEKIDTENITLSNAFDKAVLREIHRLDAHTLKLSFTGALDSEDTTCGVIQFSRECFEASENDGSVFVDVSKPLPYFENGVNHLNFDENNNVKLAFTIDTAEFSPEVTASDISFDNPAIQAVDLTIPSTESRRDGIITVQVEDATQTEILDQLREMTMTIDSHGLNCDAISLKLTLDPSPVQASLTLEDITTQNNQATASFSGTVQASEGQVDLNASSIGFSNPGLDGAVPSAINVTSAESFDFTVSINETPELAEWFADNSTLTELFACWGYSQQLELGEAVITNVYGVSEAADCYDLEIYKTMAETVLENRLSTKKAFTYTSQILNSANAFLSGNVLGGVAGIFGLGSSALDTTGEKLGAIQADLKELNTKTDEINEKISKLSKEMKEAIKNISDEQTRSKINTFGNQVDSLAWTVNKANGKNSNFIVNAMSTEIDTEDYENNIAQINGIVSSSEGGGDSFSQKTLALGKEILGEGLTEKDSILDIYTGLINERYNWKSEAKIDKENFMAYALNTYIKSYMMSMCYMQSNNENGIYENAISQMMLQFKQVAEKEAAMETEMTLNEGTDVCMVNGQTYNLDGFEKFDLLTELRNPRIGLVVNNNLLVSNRPIESIIKRTNAENFNERYAVSFDKKTLEGMKKRLSASGHNTLADEMKNVGFSLPSNEVYSGNLSVSSKVVVYSGIAIMKTLHTFMIDTVNLNSGQYNSNTRPLDMLMIERGLDRDRKHPQYTIESKSPGISALKGERWREVNWAH